MTSITCSEKTVTDNDDIKGLLGDIRKAHGEEAILIGDTIIGGVKAVSSGILALDLALGIGGLPRGRIVEIFGPESSGKTTLSLHAIAHMQSIGGRAAYTDRDWETD